MTQKHFILLVVLALVLALSPKTSLAQTATLYFNPSSGTFAEGESFWVTIMVDTKGQAVNAVGAYFSYPQAKLEALGVSTEGSIMTLWAEQEASNGKVNLAGGLPTPGFSGVKKLASVGFKVKVASGSVDLSFNADSAVITDVGNQNILNLAGSGRGAYAFKEKTAAQPPKPTQPTQPTQPSTPITEPVTQAVISNVQVKEITQRTALVSWTTDVKSASIIDYGPSENYGLTVEGDQLKQDHFLFISDLEPGTLYHFKVRSQQASGQETASGDLSFVTLGYQVEIKVFSLEDNQALEGFEVVFPGPPQASKTTDAEGKVKFENMPLGSQWISIKYDNSSAGFNIEVADQEGVQKFEVGFKKPAPRTNLMIFIVLSVVIVIGSVFVLIKIWSKPPEFA